MKQKIYIFGVITALVVFAGTIFKVNHFPGAGILLTIGIITLVLIFLPIALINNYKDEENRGKISLYIVTWITCLVIFTAMLFKIQHWPHSGVLLTIALTFPYIVFLPFFIIVTSKNKNFNIYNTVFVLFLLALNSVFSALLALNVTKEKIYDSYNLSKNYDRLEVALNQSHSPNPESNVNLKIDEVLNIVNEYQVLILKKEGISHDQWKAAPGNLWRADSRMVAAESLETAGEIPAGIKLEKGLKTLIKEMGNTPGYEALAKVAPAIFDFNDSADNDTEWPDRIFRNNTLSWALIYLDGLELNLKMIKSSFVKVN